jgi:hypothetical protein
LVNRVLEKEVTRRAKDTRSVPLLTCKFLEKERAARSLAARVVVQLRVG